MRQHVGLAIIDERPELRPLAAELVGDVAQCLAGGGAIGLDERLAQSSGGHALLCFRDMGKGVAHPVNAAALPGGTEHRRMAAFSPSCASEMTSLTPCSPRRSRPLRNIHQNVSASDGPICSPTTSRFPSVFTATATVAATERMLSEPDTISAPSQPSVSCSRNSRLLEKVIALSVSKSMNRSRPFGGSDQRYSVLTIGGNRG